VADHGGEAYITFLSQFFLDVYFLDFMRRDVLVVNVMLGVPFICYLLLFSVLYRKAETL